MKVSKSAKVLVLIVMVLSFLVIVKFIEIAGGIKKTNIAKVERINKMLGV